MTIVIGKDALQCSRCSAQPRAVGDSRGGEWLHCECGCVVPRWQGFAYFTEAFDYRGDDAATSVMVEAFEGRLAAANRAYSEFIAAPASARNRDIYAAFEPFNEASRALYALLPRLRGLLEPGALIVDLWCRTGWTGALLAGLFPEQRVLSFWDRPANVLGYTGFQHWLPRGQRAANWEIAFASPGERLPLGDGSVALVHGADCVHRFEPDALFGECLRVLGPRGAAVFPHVHLSNRQPEPYFERGGTLRPGRFYRDWFNEALGHSNRQAYVLSEQALFVLDQDTTLRDDHAGDYCNALIAVLPEASTALGTATLAFEDDAALMVNPFLRIDASSGMAQYDETSVGGHAEHLLDRHPVYRQRLAEKLPCSLSATERRLLHLVAEGHAAPAMAQALGLSAAATRKALVRLIDREVLQAAPVGQAMARLLRFQQTRRDIPPPGAHHFVTLWGDCAARYGDRPMLIADDDSVFHFADLDALVQAVACLLHAEGVRAGDRVALISTMSVEALLVTWATWRIGAVIVPLNPAFEAPVLVSLLQRLHPKRLFRQAQLRHVALDGLRSFEIGASADVMGDGSSLMLVDAMEPYFDAEPPAPPADLAERTAAILFTSGSSGTPKGVALTQGALFRSAQVLTNTLGWHAGDTLWSFGDLHAMSGLRNPALAALAGGMTLFVPAAGNSGHPAVIADTCQRRGVTVLSTVPAFLTQLRELTRLGKQPAFGALRQLAVTGAPLSIALQADVQQAFAVAVRFYYGLTETCGVCFADDANKPRIADGDIGAPCGAISRIVDSAAEPVAVGAVGQLQIYSSNLTGGYLDNPAASEALFFEGWLQTGDLAYEMHGHTVLVGRHDNQIKDAAGEIVQLEALERSLEAHASVAEAAVIARRDGSDLRELIGVVVLREPVNAEALPALERVLAGATTSRIAVRIVPLASLPRLSSGKIARSSLPDLIS